MANQEKFNYVEALSGRCFEMKQISEDTVMLRCSFLSRPRDRNNKDNGYINGINVSVMCRVVANERNPVCDIKEMDYTNKNITVWGRLYVTESHSEKTGQTYTNLNIQADKVEETVFKSSGNNENHQSSGWGSNG